MVEYNTGPTKEKKEEMKIPSFSLHITKTVIIDSGKGLDQLGNEIGMPEPGDVVKCHMKASYIAPMRPLLGFGKKTPRKKEFLDTSIKGETCFYEVTIPPATTTMKKKPRLCESRPTPPTVLLRPTSCRPMKPAACQPSGGGKPL